MGGRQREEDRRNIFYFFQFLFYLKVRYVGFSEICLKLVMISQTMLETCLPYALEKENGERREINNNMKDS